MLLRLLAILTHFWLRLLGFRRTRRQIGDWSLVFYRKGRGGEPWVLLHGLGSNALSWSAVARYLAPASRVLIPELSAIGGTEGPRAGLAIEDGVPVVAELLRRELAGEPATIVGLSLGGWLAVRLALAEPALVGRLVLIDAGGYRDQDWDRIRELVTVRGEEDVELLYRALFRRVPLIFRASRRAFRRVFTSAAVTAVIDALREEDAFGPPELAQLRMPVAVIWAEGDGLFRASVGREIARHVPQASFYLVPDVGHALHWEDPRRLVEVLEESRRELPRPAPAPTS